MVWGQVERVATTVKTETAQPKLARRPAIMSRREGSQAIKNILMLFSLCFDLGVAIPALDFASAWEMLRDRGMQGQYQDIGLFL
ncbi:hypothetical Protein YC6258_02045 [Gynuella sunshinyii YC6258]|uniref:Uncharacterized protein n=2 Tax=Gynuella sunshinyii TaxID=1445505 RepID=A0A0C5VUL3_9GAMM|nr:hypothetical Protein YC6258_02045 [Gynuella sunshinyii YC6258]